MLADQIQLQQVIANLILNAVEAMVDIQSHQPELTISSRSDDGNVAMAVADLRVSVHSASRGRECAFTTPAAAGTSW